MSRTGTALIRHLGPATALICVVALPGAASSPPSLHSLEGCYVREFPKNMGPSNYSSIRIGISAPKTQRTLHGGEISNASVSFSYRHWSLPNASFGYDDWACDFDGRRIECRVVCDGGAIKLRPLFNGDLLLHSDRLRVGEADVSSILLPQYTGDSFYFGGTYVLRRAPREACWPASRTPAESKVLFRPGDFHPMVALLSTQLAKLGFASTPGPLYSKETATAMQAFQVSMGLAPTGLADAKSIWLLNVQAVTLGGC